MVSIRSYKQLHEDFVSNLSGTSIWEIQGIACVSVVGVLLRDILIVHWPCVVDRSWLKFIIDFLLTILPVQLCLTVNSDHWSVLLVSMCVVSLGSLAVMVGISEKKVTGQGPGNSGISAFTGMLLHAKVTRLKYVLTNMRASLLVCTAICILAVDFTVFPRRFGKAETYGTGLMDGGVGIFTAMMGLVSYEAKTKSSAREDRFRQLRLTVMSSLPLFVLGVVRFITVKSADYQEHVTEYGVHWNFFFTLAVVKSLSGFVLTFLPPYLSWILAVFGACNYQYLLSYEGLSESLIKGFYGKGRHGLLDSNREGIFSCFGYLTIYWAGVTLGRIFFLCNRRSVRDWLWFVVQLFLLFIVTNLFLLLSESYIEPTSRRICNLSYILWVVAMVTQMLGLFIIEELVMICVSEHTVKNTTDKADAKCRGSGTAYGLDCLCLMSAVNYNGLAYFVVSNLLTGVINMSVRTIYSSPSVATAIITLYLLTLSFVMSALYAKKIRLKC